VPSRRSSFEKQRRHQPAFVFETHYSIRTKSAGGGRPVRLACARLLKGFKAAASSARPVRRAAALMPPYDGAIEAWEEVGAEVGNVKNNQPELMERVGLL
jgi:hypothetical protein